MIGESDKGMPLNSLIHPLLGHAAHYQLEYRLKFFPTAAVNQLVQADNPKCSEQHGPAMNRGT